MKLSSVRFRAPAVKPESMPFGLFVNVCANWACKSLILRSGSRQVVRFPTLPHGVSFFHALKYECRGGPRLFPIALDGRPLRIELAIVRAHTVVYFEMQFLPVERNWIDEKVSIAAVENVGSSDEVLFVRIRPNMHSQLKSPFLRNYLALPIA